MGAGLAAFKHYSDGSTPRVVVREGVTVYELMHEMFHALQYKSLGHLT